MTKFNFSLSAREVIDDLVPKLKATERFLGNTLAAKIAACNDSGEAQRLQTLQAEFELEIAMVHMNLEHLLKRYSEQLADAVHDPEGKGGIMLTLDEHEAVAIESIRRLYQRSHELQTA
ncbi:hypothetical protein EKK97_13510 [Billgrantia tianxiuensis]|jgi:hypothetical protein|uniref:Uncharacterized protein n=1 Tax=Billgrantia tianxiuensis TaxID=2497861 RepID=A0A6I6SPI9_9GAMM|nr:MULTISPECIES: hypothetical protein [Halomonas]MCE8034517.1 hypothetical protein [Halomonas sp. MCCC 1A11057]QHC50394.1 hypothetical protein EKK97_13510 [Halomonas tianxiuensis]